MPLSEISLDPFSAFDRLDALRAEPPRDSSRYELARRRADEVFAEFTASDEHAALDEGARWTTLVLRTAYVHHGVTLDELTPDVLHETAGRFVGQNDMSSLAHWTEVVHEELVAFFRFLERKGFANAAGNIRMLEDVVLPEMDRQMKEACEAAAEAAAIPMSGGLSILSFAFAPARTIDAPDDRARRARRKAQRAARRKNR